MFSSRRYRGKRQAEILRCLLTLDNWLLLYWMLHCYSILTDLKANHQSWYNHDLWIPLMALEDQHTKPKTGHSMWCCLTVTSIKETDKACMGSHSKAQVTGTVQKYCLRCKAWITLWSPLSDTLFFTQYDINTIFGFFLDTIRYRCDILASEKTFFY